MKKPEKARTATIRAIRAAACVALTRAWRRRELAPDAKQDAMILLRRAKRRRAQESTSEVGALDAKVNALDAKVGRLDEWCRRLDMWCERIDGRCDVIEEKVDAHGALLRAIAAKFGISPPHPKLAPLPGGRKEQRRELDRTRRIGCCGSRGARVRLRRLAHGAAAGCTGSAAGRFYRDQPDDGAGRRDHPFHLPAVTPLGRRA